MSPVYSQLGVKREALAKVLQAEIDKRVDASQLIGYGDGGGAYGASLADEIAAAGHMGLDAAKRRIYSILNPEHTNRSGKKVVQQVVDFDTADKILTSLHMNELWRTELADSIVEPPAKQQPKKREPKPCSGCGGDWNVFQPDCKTCQARRYWRVKRKKSAALVQSLDGPRHGSPRTGRVSAGGGTKPLKEAA